jgi:hypothetical protein
MQCCQFVAHRTAYGLCCLHHVPLVYAIDMVILCNWFLRGEVLDCDQ